MSTVIVLLENFQIVLFGFGSEALLNFFMNDSVNVPGARG